MEEMMAAFGTMVADILAKREKIALAKYLKYNPASIASFSTERTPRDDDRKKLKAKTIDFYGLRAPGDMVFTNCQGPSVTAEKAILAHIYPSNMARDPRYSDFLKSFGLEQGFAVDPRNFLILPPLVEKAFDAGILVLLPKKTATGHDVVIRVVNKALVTNPESLRQIMMYDGQSLRFPKADEKCLPYLRLLGWRAVSIMQNLSDGWDPDVTITEGKISRVSKYAGLLYS
jgi:hypothetical protein